MPDDFETRKSLSDIYGLIKDGDRDHPPCNTRDTALIRASCLAALAASGQRCNNEFFSRIPDRIRTTKDDKVVRALLDYTIGPLLDDLENKLVGTTEGTTETGQLLCRKIKALRESLRTNRIDLEEARPTLSNLFRLYGELDPIRMPVPSVQAGAS